MNKAERTVQLRIVVRQPPVGVAFAVQRGNKALDYSRIADENTLLFEVPVGVKTDATGQPDFTGPFVQGTPGARFIYLNSGTLAGQTDSCWTRRAKISLRGITWQLLNQEPGSSANILEVKIAGKAPNGGPACASVPLLEGGWKAIAPAATL
ncbi:MAG: DUF5990 family protein [Cytophagaceae bacterium]|nr:DUF5990 family protein [Cytophagaceae bacterium]